MWWPIEARSAAFAHSFYTVAINRVGTETYQLRSGGTKTLGPCFGSTYIAAPDGSRSKVPGIVENEETLSIIKQYRFN